MIFLKINDELYPKPNSYELEFRDIDKSTSGETEAGTIQRDIVRSAVVTISVKYNCSPKLIKKITSLKNFSKLKVEYMHTETLELKETQMYMDDLSIKLIKDTSYKGLWEVSFKLYEF